MFTGEELAAYVGKWMLRALIAVIAVSVLVGWGLAKLFD